MARVVGHGGRGQRIMIVFKPDLQQEVFFVALSLSAGSIG